MTQVTRHDVQGPGIVNMLTQHPESCRSGFVSSGDADVWMMDSAAQGWEQVVFMKSLHPDGDHETKLADANCNVEEFNKIMPANRAGHTAVQMFLRRVHF